LRLRPYHPDDFDRLIEIDRACFQEGIAYSEEELRYYLHLPSAAALVGYVPQSTATVGQSREDDRGEIQGFIVADQHRPRGARQCVGKIITIDVMAQARRAGLGSRLLDAAEKHLQEAGCAYVALEVAVDNFPALRFYKKHGYTGVRILPRYYLGSLDGLLMQKKLGS